MRNLWGHSVQEQPQQRNCLFEWGYQEIANPGWYLIRASRHQSQWGVHGWGEQTTKDKHQERVSEEERCCSQNSKGISRFSHSQNTKEICGSWASDSFRKVGPPSVGICQLAQQLFCLKVKQWIKEKGLIRAAGCIWLLEPTGKCWRFRVGRWWYEHSHLQAPWSHLSPCRRQLKFILRRRGGLQLKHLLPNHVSAWIVHR